MEVSDKALKHIADSDPGPQSDQTLAHDMALVAKQALSTQAAELDALRGEVERLTLDGIHTCSDACQRPACVLRRENAQLRDRVAGLEHIASDLLQHIDWLTCGLPKMLEDAALTDEEGLIGAAVDAANSARALLTQNEVG